jgi:monoamine oxidase
MAEDVIIIGAGLAGLMAARVLARERISFLIFEAEGHIGGRAASLMRPSGVAVDLGGQWLHGEKNPLKAVLDEYEIPYQRQGGQPVRIYEHGTMRKDQEGQWLEQAVDKKKSAAVKQGKLPDCPLTDLARDAAGKEVLKTFALMWYGLTPPEKPSAHEYLTDQNQPGGLQIKGGVHQLLDKLAADVGEERIRLKTPVLEIRSEEGHAHLVTARGEEWQARRAIFTGSLGVLKSGLVTFTPPLSAAMQKNLEHIAMGKMNRIILEMEPGFFEERGIGENTAMVLLDGTPPHFCHMRSVGRPLISLFIAGPVAERVEHFSGEEAIRYMKQALSPVKELHGFEREVKGAPIVTRWCTSRYTQGSYSVCLPGGTRSLPREEGQVIFCGDTFDMEYPASLAGAARSGTAAGRMAIAALRGALGADSEKKRRRR